MTKTKTASNKEDASNISDEELRKLTKPKPTKRDLLDLLQDLFVDYSTYVAEDDIQILKELDSYDDCNHLVKIKGTKYLLKIHNGVESVDYIRDNGSGTSKLDLGNAMYNYLSSRGIQTNTLIPNKRTEIFKIPQEYGGCPEAYLVELGDVVSLRVLPVLSKDYTPRVLAVQLMSWIEGCPMCDVPNLPIETLAEAGVFLGKLSKMLDGMAEELPGGLPTACHRYHQWDGKQFADVRKFLDCIDDPKRRAMVESILDAFQSEIIDDGVGSSFRTGLIQGDFNDANILLSGKSDLKVTGVIDFGDSIESWRVLDVSIAMTYAMISSFGKTHHMLAAAAAVLRGVQSVYPLTIEERKHLRLLMACRLATSCTFGAFSFKQNPENTYLLLHAQPAWDAMELLWGGGCDAQSINRLFDAACQIPSSFVPDTPTTGSDIAAKKENVDDKVSKLDCSDICIPDPCIKDLLKEAREASNNGTSDVVMEGSDEASSNSNKRTKGSKPTITFVTGNKKKLEEVKQIIQGSQSSNNMDDADTVSFPFELTNEKIDLPELQGDDPVAIAKEKCRLACEKVGGPVITEDTSLCFNALQGLPGPYIKWFLDKCGHDGLNNMIAFSEDKSAYAQTIFAFCPKPGEVVETFDGRTRGTIVPARGPTDFGWDPIFEPFESNGLTYAEMTKDDKNAISHRGRSLRLLKEYLTENSDLIVETL